MADGETHLRYLNYGWFVVVPTSVIIAFVAAYYEQPWYLYLAFTNLNYFLCRWSDPDDDLSSMTSSEGRLQGELKAVNPLLGLLGAIINAYKVIYAYIIGLMGGHRSPASHGFLIGTLGRMFFYDGLFGERLYSLGSYLGTIWLWQQSPYYNLYMDVWLIPFLITQFITWTFADAIHIILDTDYAKGRFYTPIKTKRR